MKRLTTEEPQGNFETMMNYVYSKDGWAYIRHDGVHEDVPLTQWARRQCAARGCADEDLPGDTPEEIDEALCGCMMDCPDCPIALAYCFSSQAVHLRDRLKRYEDTGLEPEEINSVIEENKRLKKLAQAEKEGRLWMLAVLPQGRPGGQRNGVYVIEDGEIYDDYVVGVYIGVDSNGELRCGYETYDGSDFYDADIGKTAFLTREEAETAQKKMEEIEGCCDA